MAEKVNLTIKATNTQLTPDVRRLVEEKFGALSKFVRPHKDQEIRFEAEVGKKNKAESKNPDSFFAELNIVAGGERHRAVASAPELRVAIDQVKKEMTVHLSRAHDKNKDNFEKGARVMKEVLHADLSPKSEIEQMIEEEAEKILATSIKTEEKKKNTATKKKPKITKSKIKAKKTIKKAVNKSVSKKTKGPKHGKKNTRGAKNRPPRKLSPKR